MSFQGDKIVLFDYGTPTWAQRSNPTPHMDTKFFLLRCTCLAFDRAHILSVYLFIWVSTGHTTIAGSRRREGTARCSCGT